MSYDMIDRFLRNNLHDDDYAEYSAALDAVVAGAVAAERERCAVVCDFADGCAAQREHGAKLAALIRGPNAKLNGPQGPHER